MRTGSACACFAALAAVAGCAGGQVTVANRSLSIAFDAAGRVRSLRNPAGGAELLHGAPSLPLRLYRHSGNALTEVTLHARSAPRSLKSGRAMAVEYAGPGVVARVTVEAPDQGGRTDWRVAVTNQGGEPIAEVVFPSFVGARVGTKGSDDWLVRPNRYGQRIPDPERNLERKEGEVVDGLPYAGWWNQPRLIYPGSAGMFWMDLHDASGGLYLASADKTLIGGFLESKPGNGLALGIGKYVRIQPGQTLALPAVVGIHAGDWRWGARTYRRWAEAFMRKPQTPTWAREMPNWYWRAMLWSMGPTRPPLTSPFSWADLDGKLMDGALALGSSVVGLAGQEFMGHDFGYWWPDPTLGGEALLRRRMADVRRRGGKVVPYINPIYVWEGFPAVPHADDHAFQERLAQAPPDSAAPRPLWERYRRDTARKYDGVDNYVETHYFGNLAQTCLASRQWQDYVLFWTHKYATDYGFAGVQWDQLGAYPSQYCTNEAHGHSVSGTGAQGMLQLADRMWGDPRYRVPKDFYIWYEGASDVAAQRLHMGHAGYDMWMPYSYPEMIAVTFPGAVFSGEYPSLPGVSGPAKVRYQRSVELSLLARGKLGSGGDEHGRKIEAVGRLTEALKGLYWYTGYRGDEGIQSPAGLRFSLLEVDRAECPFAAGPTWVLPYMDTRSDRAAARVLLDPKAMGIRGPVRATLYRGDAPDAPVAVPLRPAAGGRLEMALPAMDAVSPFSREQAYCAEDGTTSSIGLVVVSATQPRRLRLLAPQTVRRGLAVTLRTVEERIIGIDARAEIVEGKPAGGLVPVDVADGKASVVRRAGRLCRRIALPDAPYAYFHVTDSRFTSGAAMVQVELEYLDEGVGAFRLQYNSSDPFAMPYKFGEFNSDHKASAWIHKRGTGRWRTATLTLPDARFAGAMSNGADLRVDAWGGTQHIAALRLKRLRVERKPVPGMSVMVGSDRRTTGRDGSLTYTFAAGDPTGWYVLDARKPDRSGLLPTGGRIKLQE